MSELKLVTEKERDKEARKQVLENRKITREEIAKRAHQIRLELEAAKQCYDGALMNNVYNGIPVSLDVGNENESLTTLSTIFAHQPKGHLTTFRKASLKVVFLKMLGPCIFTQRRSLIRRHACRHDLR